MDMINDHDTDTHTHTHTANPPHCPHTSPDQHESTPS